MTTAPALTAILASAGIVTLDVSIANTALPTIAADLGADAAAAVWIVNAYHLAMTACLLPVAALGEIVGHRRVFLAGLAGFTLASLGCGLAPSLETLVAARVVQGIGAAAVSGVTPALIRFLYPPHRLGRGLGIYAAVVGAAFTVGPTAASAILSVSGWPWLFLVNVPIGAAAALLTLRTLPATARSARPFDALSALLCAGFFSLLLLGLNEAARGAAWPAIAAPLGIAALCGALLARREPAQPTPILAIDLFRRPVFALSSATSVCAFAVQGAAFVALPFLMHTALGYSQVQIGLLITPWPATVAAMALVAAPLADRCSTALLGSAGLLLLCAGLATLALLPGAASPAALGWRLAVCGIGFGLFQTPNMKAIMSNAPPERSGGASGIVAASRMLGQSLGAVLVALCLSLSPQHGAGLALWVASALALLGSLVSAARLLPHSAGPPPKPSPERQ